MKLHLSRFLCLDPASNLDRMEAEGREAARQEADLVVFPESFLHGYTRQVDPRDARRRFAALSREHPATAFLFGSFSEDGRNRMTVWKDGQERARYDKVHLFQPNGEAQLWTPGDCYVAVEVQGWRIGLLNCNDVRFPEQARALRLEARVDLLLAVAWWPWRRDHIWEALLRARAIENAVFCAGCCIAASEVPGERFAGAGNHVFDPLGDPVPTTDDHTYLLQRSLLGCAVVDPLATYVDIQRVTCQTE